VDAQLAQYIPVLILLVLAAGVSGGMLLLSHLLGKAGRRSPVKDTAYECGMVPVGTGSPRLSVKFYLVAMLFILFDIEVVFLVPWAFVYRDFLSAGIPILLPVLFFIGILALGLFYEVRKGALDWEK